MSLPAKLRRELLSLSFDAVMEGARGLFERLSGEPISREAFRAEMEALFRDPPEKADFGPEWETVMDRLRRAAEPPLTREEPSD